MKDDELKKIVCCKNRANLYKKTISTELEKTEMKDALVSLTKSIYTCIFQFFRNAYSSHIKDFRNLLSLQIVASFRLGAKY